MNRPQLKITPGALVCNEAEIIGDVTIGVRTVIHPKASIIAEKGGNYSFYEMRWYQIAQSITFFCLSRRLVTHSSPVLCFLEKLGLHHF